MNVNNIMDLGGSQSTSKTSRGAASTSKSQAASSDLFKSIIGQKRAGSQTQSGLDVASPAAQQTGGSAQKTQQSSASRDTSSTDSPAPAEGNESKPADNLESAQTPEDAAVSETETDSEPVMEDEAAAAEEVTEEETAEPSDKLTDEPKQIFLIQSPIVAAATIAPVIISSETYQTASVETIVNDVVMSEIPSEPQVLMQVSEAQITLTPEQIDVETGQFTAVAEPVQEPVEQAAPEAPAQTVPDMADDLVQAMTTVEEAAPEIGQDVQTQARPAAAETHAAQQRPVAEQPQHEQEAPLQAVPQDAEREPAAAAPQTQPAATPLADAAEEFAAQVVTEAKDLVQQTAAEGPQEVNLEAVPDADAEQVSAVQTEADDTDDASGKDSGQSKQSPAQTTAMPGTAQVAEDGRLDLRTAAAQPLEAEQYLQPETRQMIMSRVVDQVRSAVSPDRTEFYVQLKPDFLGGLSIGLVAEEKGIVAKIMTTSQQVHATLQSDMSQLQQVLRDRGINVVEMEVIYNQMADTSSKDNSDNRQQQFSQGDGRSHGRISEQTEEALMTYDSTLSSQEVLTENGGSVEFTA